MFYIVYGLIGVFAGTLSGLLGLGGGLIVVPALATAFRYQGIIPEASAMHFVIGTSLAVMIFTTLSAAIAQAKRKNIRWDLVKILIPGFSVGIISGAFIQQLLPTQYLKILFGLFLIFVSYRLFKPALTQTIEGVTQLRLAFIATACMGILGSLLGIGGGIIMLPYLLKHGVNIREAMGTTTVCGMWIGVLASTLYIFLGSATVPLPNSLGFIYLPAFFGITLTSVIFAPLGAGLAQYLSTEKLKKVLAVFLLLVAGDMLIF